MRALLLILILLPLAALAAPLETEIAARRARVPEFAFIAQEAEKLGLRAWLFGGTAAGYAHYVKWDLARESGDARYQKDRFDYDYTNIYRSTQDLDIVVDGPADKAAELETLLKEKFAHFQGGKSVWEVRLLREQRGDKEPLLGNPNYLDQHTDSNSTGMIELTHPAHDEPVVRDLLDWKAKDPYFLQDVREGKLHYYFSPKHHTTNRAKEGLNPPIESAVRYLTKAFQYELELRPADLAAVKQVIQEFDPQSVSEPVRRWLEKNGKKLFQHAVNLEYARKVVDDLGLAPKLIAVDKNTDVVDTLAWWMQKEPLRSKDVGQGTGLTAAEIFAREQLPSGPNGELVVAHETKSFLAYESITRAHTGAPNVLISRQKAAGESALHGDGFYTRAGRQGAVGTGLTVRFTLDPRAREGEDFLYVPHEHFFVVKNKKALRVIPESLNWTPKEYFSYLRNADDIRDGNLALVEKLKRRLKAHGAFGEGPAMREAAAYVTAASREAYSPAMLGAWFAEPASVKYSDELLRVLTEETPHLSDTLQILTNLAPWNPSETQRALREKQVAIVRKIEEAPSKEALTILMKEALARDPNEARVYFPYLVEAADLPPASPPRSATEAIEQIFANATKVAPTRSRTAMERTADFAREPISLLLPHMQPSDFTEERYAKVLKALAPNKAKLSPADSRELGRIGLAQKTEDWAWKLGAWAELAPPETLEEPLQRILQSDHPHRDMFASQLAYNLAHSDDGTRGGFSKEFPRVLSLLEQAPNAGQLEATFEVLLRRAHTDDVRAYYDKLASRESPFLSDTSFREMVGLLHRRGELFREPADYQRFRQVLFGAPRGTSFYATIAMLIEEGTPEELNFLARNVIWQMKDADRLTAMLASVLEYKQLRLEPDAAREVIRLVHEGVKKNPAVWQPINRALEAGIPRDLLRELPHCASLYSHLAP